jgi:hypothetical protein
VNDVWRTIVIAVGAGVASSAREVDARVVFALLYFPDVLNGQLIPLVRR